MHPAMQAPRKLGRCGIGLPAWPHPPICSEWEKRPRWWPCQIAGWPSGIEMGRIDTVPGYRSWVPLSLASLTRIDIEVLSLFDWNLWVYYGTDGMDSLEFKGCYIADESYIWWSECRGLGAVVLPITCGCGGMCVLPRLRQHHSELSRTIHLAGLGIRPHGTCL